MRESNAARSMSEEEESGRMPMSAIIPLIKLAHSGVADGDNYVGYMTPIGTVVDWLFQLGDTTHPVPEGWAPCDGSYRQRRGYPEAAVVLRRYTSWWRWHLGREFQLPRRPFQFGIDMAGTPEDVQAGGQHG